MPMLCAVPHVLYPQWTHMLDLAEISLGKGGWKLRRLDGTMSQQKRESALKVPSSHKSGSRGEGGRGGRTSSYNSTSCTARLDYNPRSCVTADELGCLSTTCRNALAICRVPLPALPLKIFAADETVTVMLVSLKAGGVGLNLTAASTVILLDPWW